MATLPSPSSEAIRAAKPTPNIDASDAVLHINSASLIDASSLEVWNALIDTSTWPSWNAFVPRVTVREQPGADAQSASSDALSPVLQLGTKMTFHVQMDPSSPRPQTAQGVALTVVEFDPPDAAAHKPGRIVWANDVTAKGGIPSFLLTAERVHEIEEVAIEEEGGATRRATEVRNWEAQVGYLVYVVRWMYGSQLKKNFETWVRDLKQYVEQKKSGN